MAYGGVKYNEPGSGTDVGFDDVSSVHYQGVKLINATAGSSTPTGVAGDPLIVDQANAVDIDYDTGGGTVNQVCVGIALPASGGPVAGGTGTNPLRTDPTGTTAQPATQSGTWNIATVTTVTTVSAVSAITPGTGATNLGKAEDAAHASGDVGVMGLAVRTDAPANRSGTDGDYEPFQMSGGRLWVDASGKTLTVSGTVTANAGTGTWTVQATNFDIRALASGTDSVTAVISGTAATTSVGTVADDSVASGSPLVMGAWAVETDGTDPTSVSAEGDVTRLRSDRNRRLLVNTAHPFLWDAKDNQATAQTNKSLKAAPGAGLSFYVTDFIISNGATAGTVKLVEDTAGTPVDRTPPFYLAANGGVAKKLATPLRIAANKNIGYTSTGVTTHSIQLFGYTAP